MDVPAVIAVFTPVMPVFTALMKVLFPKVNPRYFALGFSVVVAVTMGVLNLVLDHGTLESMMAEVGFISAFVFGVGTGLYKVQK